MFLSIPVPKPVTVDRVSSVSQVIKVRTTLPCLSSGSAGISQEIDKLLELGAYNMVLVGGPTSIQKKTEQKNINNLIIDFKSNELNNIIMFMNLPRQLSRSVVIEYPG